MFIAFVMVIPNFYCSETNVEYTIVCFDDVTALNIMQINPLMALVIKTGHETILIITKEN